jgi:predicted phosphodiesterase
MKIIHFSDSHAGGPAEDWMAYIDKRWVGVFNYRFRRQFQHDQTMLAKAVDYIVNEKPDLAVCTGDLTSTGQPGEFKKALDALKPLHDSDIPLIYVPGNHDYYVYYPTCVEAMKNAVKYLNKDNFLFDDLPVVREFGECEFIIVNECCPTNLISSCGYLRKKSSDFIVEKTSSGKTKPRILIGHYPLIEDHPILRIRHRLWGEKEALRLLNEEKIDISLCGHMHLPYARINERGRGEICAGSITRNSCLSVIEYNKNENIFVHKSLVLD